MSVEIKHAVDAGMGPISAVITNLVTGTGYAVGDVRMESGIKYKLLYNAGNSQINPGFVCVPIGSAGPYSMTLSSASKVFAHIGAAVVVNKTAVTGTYFWGAVRGRVGALAADATSIPTGSGFFIASNGQVELMPQSLITGNVVCGINLGGAASKTITCGAASGDAMVSFQEI